MFQIFLALALAVSISLNFLLLDTRDEYKKINAIKTTTITKQNETINLLKEQLDLYKIEIRMYKKLTRIKEDL